MLAHTTRTFYLPVHCPQETVIVCKEHQLESLETMPLVRMHHVHMYVYQSGDTYLWTRSGPREQFEEMPDENWSRHLAKIKSYSRNTTFFKLCIK